MQHIREQLDAVDHQLLALLKERQALVEQIGVIKHATQAPVVQPARAQQVFEARRAWAEAMGLDADFVEALWHVIHTESCRVQQLVMDRLKEEETVELGRG